jgi:hypothetical protein
MKKKLKSGSAQDNCTPVFTAVLFTIAKKLSEPNCPSMDEWTKKM